MWRNANTFYRFRWTLCKMLWRREKKWKMFSSLCKRKTNQYTRQHIPSNSTQHTPNILITQNVAHRKRRTFIIHFALVLIFLRTYCVSSTNCASKNFLCQCVHWRWLSQHYTISSPLAEKKVAYALRKCSTKKWRKRNTEWERERGNTYRIDNVYLHAKFCTFSRNDNKQ